MITVLRPALLGALLVGATGCTGFVPPKTAQDLARSLDRRGIAFERTEPLDFATMRFAKIEEGLRLTGEDLRIEILRIEDPRTFEVASSAGFLLRLFDDPGAEGALGAPEIYAAKPFVVVIRQEPEPGKTRRALQAILPDEPDN